MCPSRLNSPLYVSPTSSWHASHLAFQQSRTPMHVCNFSQGMVLYTNSRAVEMASWFCSMSDSQFGSPGLWPVPKSRYPVPCERHRGLFNSTDPSEPLRYGYSLGGSRYHLFRSVQTAENDSKRGLVRPNQRVMDLNTQTSSPTVADRSVTNHCRRSPSPRAHRGDPAQRSSQRSNFWRHSVPRRDPRPNRQRLYYGKPPGYERGDI